MEVPREQIFVLKKAMWDFSHIDCGKNPLNINQLKQGFSWIYPFQQMQ